MPPPPADVQQQSRINAGIVALAAGQTAALWPQVDWASPAAASAVRKLYGAIVGQFGQSAAAVAAQFYDEQRTAAAVPGQFTAALSDPLPAVMLDKIVTSAFLGGVEPDHTHAEESATTGDLPVEERVPARLDGSLQRLVLQPGRETIARNADRDPAKARYVRVPRGAKTCEFCVVLASREIQKVKGSRANFSGYDRSNVKFDTETQRLHVFAENGEKYHKKCDCEAVPVFPGMSVEDVSPNIADYKDMYYKAAADAGTHSDLKKILASMRKQNRDPGVSPMPDNRRTNDEVRNKVGPTDAVESKAQIAKRLLPGIEKSLRELRAKGLSEESSQITYHLKQIKRLRGDLK